MNYYYTSSRRLEGVTEPSLYEEGSRVEASKDLLRLYDAGVPFFTKESIRDVQRQLQKSSPGDKLRIKGVNGEVVVWDIETGERKKYGEGTSSAREFVLHTPTICYRSFQQLTRIDSPCSNRTTAYSNLTIEHNMSHIDKSTGAIQNPDPPQPLEKLEEYFQTNRKAWEESEQFDKLKSILITEETPEIRKVIGFGCGEMIVPNGDGPRCHRPSFQHALILSLRDILRDKLGASDKIDCYAQDPAYTASDKTVLEGSGINILENPEGFLEVDDSSVVFSCSPNVPVKQIVSEVSRPAIMIWNRIESEDPTMIIGGRRVIFTDPDSPRLRDMVHRYYDEFSFPGEEKHFGDLSIYIRRTEASVTN